MISDHVPGNAKQPRVEVRAALELAQTAVHDDPELLCGIVEGALAQAKIAQHAPHKIEILIVELLEGGCSRHTLGTRRDQLERGCQDRVSVPLLENSLQRAKCDQKIFSSIPSAQRAVQLGAGQVTFSPAGGVTIGEYQSKTKLAGQYAGATIVKLATDTWVLVGNLA